MNFNHLARHYDWLEAVTAGQRLQRARIHWLNSLTECRQILSVGEGHGRFARACLENIPGAELTCVEASPAMLSVARNRLGSLQARVHWECADVLTWQADRKFDAIVTCYFLDCFPPDQLAGVVERLAGAASEKALWLVTDFAVPERGPARWRAKAIHSLMYAFFRAFTSLSASRLTPPDGLLRKHGFELRRRSTSEWGLLHSDLWRR